MSYICRLILLFMFSFLFAIEADNKKFFNIYNLLNRNECEDFSQGECEYLDYCEWTDEGCVYADDGPPDCVLDCEGIEDVNPDEDPYGFCEWIINLDIECTEDFILRER